MASVHCHFEKFDASLLPGMFMNADVKVNNQTALAVAEQAIVKWQNKYYVFTDQGQNTFRMVPVTVGNQNNGQQHINGQNITANTKLVTQNAYSLLMKMKNNAEEE
jgi:cobalt-zinc-cadmium efflux system membrane fusion protein